MRAEAVFLFLPLMFFISTVERVCARARTWCVVPRARVSNYNISYALRTILLKLTLVQTFAYIIHMISEQPSEVGSQIIVILQSRKLRLRKVRPRKLMAEPGLEFKFLDSQPQPGALIPTMPLLGLSPDVPEHLESSRG